MECIIVTPGWAILVDSRSHCQESPIASLFALLADLIVLLHALFVLFVVGGQGLILIGWARGWQWTRRRGWRLAHLGAIGIVVFETVFGIVCPLTQWEQTLRQGAGQTPYEMSFIGYWLNQWLFYTAPDWVFTLVYLLFGALVAFSYWRYPPR